MEFDFANPMYAFACIRLTRSSYEFVFVWASPPARVLVMTSPVAVGLHTQASSSSLKGSFGFRCLSFGLDAMASAGSRLPRGMPWSDEASASSGEEYMEDFKAGYKAERSGHKGGLQERVQTAQKEQLQKGKKLQTWVAKAKEPVDKAMRVAVRKENSITRTLACCIMVSSIWCSIGLYRFLYAFVGFL